MKKPSIKLIESPLIFTPTDIGLPNKTWVGIKKVLVKVENGEYQKLEEINTFDRLCVFDPAGDDNVTTFDPYDFSPKKNACWTYSVDKSCDGSTKYWWSRQPGKFVNPLTGEILPHRDFCENVSSWYEKLIDLIKLACGSISTFDECFIVPGKHLLDIILCSKSVVSVTSESQYHYSSICLVENIPSIKIYTNHPAGKAVNPLPDEILVCAGNKFVKIKVLDLF